MKIRGWIGMGVVYCGTLFAQQALDNDAVLKMVKAGLGDQVIISMVQSQPGAYQVTRRRWWR